MSLIASIGEKNLHPTVYVKLAQIIKWYKHKTLKPVLKEYAHNQAED